MKTIIDVYRLISEVFYGSTPGPRSMEQVKQRLHEHGFTNYDDMIVKHDGYDMLNPDVQKVLMEDDWMYFTEV